MDSLGKLMDLLQVVFNARVWSAETYVLHHTSNYQMGMPFRVDFSWLLSQYLSSVNKSECWITAASQVTYVLQAHEETQTCQKMQVGQRMNERWCNKHLVKPNLRKMVIRRMKALPVKHKYKTNNTINHINEVKKTLTFLALQEIRY